MHCRSHRKSGLETERATLWWVSSVMFSHASSDPCCISSALITRPVISSSCKWMPVLRRRAKSAHNHTYCTARLNTVAASWRAEQLNSDLWIVSDASVRFTMKHESKQRTTNPTLARSISISRVNASLFAPPVMQNPYASAAFSSASLMAHIHDINDTFNQDGLNISM